MPVLEGKTNFLSGMFLRWLEFIVARLNKIIIDESGNIAYGGATIPTDLHPDWVFEIWPNNIYAMRSRVAGNIYHLANAYYNDSNQWYQPDSSVPSSLTVQLSSNTTQIIEMRVATTLQPSNIITWVYCLRFGDDGELHLKTGTTIQYDL